MGIKLAHPVTDDDNFDLIGADYYWTFMEDQVISSLVWPDPWIGPCVLVRADQRSVDPSLRYLCVYHYSGRANQIVLFHKMMLY